MKRILIFSHALEIGGAERALLGLLNSIDTTKYEVELFLMRHEGELLRYIPHGIKLLPELKEYASLAVPIKDVIKKRQYCVALGRVYGKYKANRYVKKNQITKENSVSLEYSHKYTRMFMPNVGEGEYDLAISFLTPHYFVTEKVCAKCKIAWIHTDYSYIELNLKSEAKMWAKYDWIVSISSSVTKSFINKFPDISHKIIEMENIIFPEFISMQSQEFKVDDEMPKDNIVNLLSVGRFCGAKNFDNIPDICKKIIEKGLNVRWYIIGFGPEEELIRKKIIEAKMENNVIILGKKVNPYPYIAACDVYIQPSRYEGKSITVKEAQILGKPVIITNYGTATSQLDNNVDGIIVPMDNELCAKEIITLLNDETMIQTLVENCRIKDYSNVDELAKIYKIIEY